MKRLLSKLHLWMAMPFGLIITVICFSGATLVFEDEITHWVDRDFYNVDSKGKAPLPMNDLVNFVSCKLPDSVKVTGVTVFADSEKAYKVNLSKPRKAAIYINQYTGEVKGYYQRLPFFQFMFRLHRWLLDSMRPQSGLFIGRMIVGISTIMFTLLIISGVIIWIPKSFKNYRRRFKLVLNKGKRRMFFTLHAVGGVYAAMLLLVMALTGLTWSFTWYKTVFYQLFGVELVTELPRVMTKSDIKPFDDRSKEKITEYKFWQQVLETLQTDCSSYYAITINNGNANVSTGHWGNKRSSDKYIFNSQTGEILKTELYQDQPKSNKIRGWIYSVHTGSFVGYLSKIVWLMAAIIGTVLPLTGYYLWFKKALRKRY